MIKNGLEEVLGQDLIEDIVDDIINCTLGEIYQEETLEKNCERFLGEIEERQLEYIDANVADCNFSDGTNNYKLTEKETKTVRDSLIETCIKLIKNN